MAHSERFEIELPPDLAAYVHSKVGQDSLASDSDVLREAVRIMQRRDSELRALRDKVEASIADPRPSLTDDEVGEHFRRRAQWLQARGDHA